MPRAPPCRAARGEATPSMLPATWRSYPPRGPSTESSSIFARVLFFDLIFRATFGGLLVLKMGHAAYRRKAHDIYFSTI
jgi:hypothetical protein